MLPLRNCTVPVGAMPLLSVLIVAVRLSTSEEAADALNVVVVGAGVMVIGTVGDLLPV